VFANPVPPPAQLGIQLWACPHCGRMGTLIGHGYLRGYAEQGQDVIVRGRRVFCSDRHRRPGCGRTFSLLIATLLAGFLVTTLTLFRFVEQVLAGLTRRTAWHAAAQGALSSSSGYRLWRRLDREQSHLRARLCREATPLSCAHREPVAELVAHLQAVLAGATCPFAAFQGRFQEDLFA
jgi:hypothetical protein